jgi:signal transduction histidine kinase
VSSSEGDAALPATDVTRRDRRLRLLARVAFSSVVAGFLLRAVLSSRNVAARSDLETGTLLDAILMIFPIVGLLLASKRPRNPLGWLLLAIGWAFVASPGAAYARYASVTRGDLPGAGLALAVDAPMWVVFVGLSGFVLLLFPDGHLPTPGWRWFARICAAGLTGLFLAILLSPDQGVDYDLPHVENPIALEVLRDAGWILAIVAFVPLTVVGGAIALIRRRRGTTDPVQRLQLRWVTWAAAVAATAYVVAIVPAAVFGVDPDTELPSLLGSVAVVTFLLIPIAIAIAILRYRLYDIDFVVKKTVVIAVLLSFIALVYAAIVVGVGALVGSGAGDPVLSAIAAAVVALAFQPLRLRARRLADRVVYGERATPYEVLGAFGEQLAGTYSAGDVLPRIARVLGEGVGATRATVRLKVGDEMRAVARWPSDAVDEEVDGFATEVRHQGEVLGALSVSLPPDEPLDPTKEELVRHLAGQAGLVLSNVRLTEELRARLEDLRAAQKRLVTAQDAERKRLERNIHDGAQQQLVALAVKLKLAEQLTRRDPEKASDALVQLQADTTRTLEDLRDLARGIFPPLLADQGLGAALAAQVRRSTFPVEVDVELDRRYPPEVEAAVYFSCLEALQNVAKYARATHATVRVAAERGTLTFEVRDDGRGFDPNANGYGTGLQGIADRLGALDGRLEIDTAPGRGTTIRGRLPDVGTAVATGEEALV